MRLVADGSKWQGITDPAQMRRMMMDIWPGEEPAVIWKLSEVLSADPTGKLNVLKSHDAGFTDVGGYAFYSTSIAWKSQADRYLSEWDKVALEVYPAIDLEGAAGYPLPNSRYQYDVLEWLRYVAARTGADPMVYSSVSWLRSYIKLVDYRRYPLWIAHWGAAAPTVPAPWFAGAWSIWQTGVYPADGLGVQSSNIDISLAQNLPRMP